MRLKIKQVQPSPDVQIEENREVMKEEVEEENDRENENGWPVPNENNSNKSPIDLSPITPSVQQHLGKRKRKPKELIDEVSPVIIRRKKKKSSDSKSDQD